MIVVMGVSGVGKTTVGRALARALDLPYRDGDDVHPPANVEKMARGIPLTDADRRPWLDSLGHVMADAAGAHGGVVAACSALKRAYRVRLAGAFGRPLLFVHLHGDRALLHARMAARRGHYMPPSLLDSQLADLEPPAADEPALTLSVDQDVDTLVQAVLKVVAPDRAGQEVSS